MTTLKFILEEEGFRSKPYLDSLGISTIGHGLTYITKSESEYIVQNRIYEIIKKLEDDYSWFKGLSENRKTIIISMVYQLGLNGFRKFKNMIKAIENNDFSTAKKEGLDSLWAKQTPSRAIKQMDMLEIG